MSPAPGRRAHWLVRGVLAALLGLVAAAAAPGVADAHTGFEGSTPAEGATVTSLPAAVRLRFEDPVLPGTAAGVLTGPDGTVALATPAVRGTVVTMTLPRVRHAGRVSLAWRVVAQDGHPVSGTLGLRVAASAVRGPTPAAAPAPGTDPTAASPHPSPVATVVPDAASVAVAATEAAPAPSSPATGGPGLAWGVFALLLLLAGALPRVLTRHRPAALVGTGR